jgi:hypothetical protein
VGGTNTLGKDEGEGEGQGGERGSLAAQAQSSTLSDPSAPRRWFLVPHSRIASPPPPCSQRAASAEGAAGCVSPQAGRKRARDEDAGAGADGDEGAGPLLDTTSQEPRHDVVGSGGAGTGRRELPVVIKTLQRLLAGLQVLWRAFLSPHLQKAASPRLECRALAPEENAGGEGAGGATGTRAFSWGSSHFGVSSSLVDLTWFVGDAAQARARIECLISGGALPALQKARLELQVGKEILPRAPMAKHSC